MTLSYPQPPVPLLAPGTLAVTRVRFVHGSTPVNPAPISQESAS